MNNKNKKSKFYIKFDWMFSELHLSDTACDVFALIFSFNRNNKFMYYGTLQYLANRINVSEKSVSRALKYLVDIGYVEKTKISYNSLTRPAYKVKDNIVEQYKEDLEFLMGLSEGDECMEVIPSETDKMSYTQDKMSYIDGINEENAADKMSIYNKYNINTIFLSKSNKLDLSKKIAHSEECDRGNTSNNCNSFNTEVPVCYKESEENKNSAPVPEPQAQGVISVDKEQEDIDKINSLKLFKHNNTKKGKQKKETVFVKCAKIINSNPTYSKNLKDLLYSYLKFRITRRGLTEDIWKQLLSQLEDAVSGAPINDINKLNYLKEFVVNYSLCAQYNTFYPINDRKLAELLASYNYTALGVNVDRDGIPKQYHGPIDKSKLATNPDGTPMTF